MEKTLIELAKEAQQSYKYDIVLAKVNGKLKELLKDDIITDQNVEFITTESSIGNQTYRRSIVLMMLYSIYKIAPKDSIKKVCVEYSISKGLYCDMIADFEITEEFLNSVKEKMKETAEKNLPIRKITVSTDEAVSRFEKHMMYDKVKLFKYRRSSTVNIYNLDGFEDYYYGYMVPSTGILNYFELYRYEGGFVLQLPVKSAPTEVPPFNPQIKLFNVLRESTQWANMLEVDTVGALNDTISDGSISDLMLVQEALQEQKISEIARNIASQPEKKFVMIAGPSSSGKTTFSHRLSIQLRACGMKPHPIAVDNYFVEREETPLDENGQLNFESIYAIDLELFNRQMTELLEGKTVEIPTFNFKTGRKEYNGNFKTLREDDILVIEGIHCLNDEMSKSLPRDSKFKIYISALTQLNIDEHNRVSTTDGRLLRRMVRDARTRGASAQRTLGMWDSVRRGEEMNIFPYQEEADAMFNSALIHEVAVLKPYAEPLLFAIGKDEPEYLEAKRLLKFLDYFLAYGSDKVPNNSILREFVGGGCFNI